MISLIAVYSCGGHDMDEGPCASLCLTLPFERESKTDRRIYRQVSAATMSFFVCRKTGVLGESHASLRTTRGEHFAHH